MSGIPPTGGIPGKPRTVRAATIDEVFDAATSGLHPAGNHIFHDYHQVTPAEASEIQRQTGIDVSGFVHSIDLASARHVINRHVGANERDRRNVPLARNDVVVLLPEVVRNPDRIVLETRVARQSGTPVIRFEKNIGGTLVVMAEVRTGRRKLTLKSMYRQK